MDMLNSIYKYVFLDGLYNIQFYLYRAFYNKKISSQEYLIFMNYSKVLSL